MGPKSVHLSLGYFHFEVAIWRVILLGLPDNDDFSSGQFGETGRSQIEAAIRTSVVVPNKIFFRRINNSSRPSVVEESSVVVLPRIPWIGLWCVLANVDELDAVRRDPFRNAPHKNRHLGLFSTL